MLQVKLTQGRNEIMGRGPNFIEREVFESIMTEVPRVDGGPYQDLATAYGDMSRLVVGWLANTPPEELKALYNKFGWQGSANARQFHLAAKQWYATYQSERSAGPGRESSEAP
jgi:hypothetical protein